MAKARMATRSVNEERLVVLLGKRVEESGLSQRALEAAAGWGHGTLGNLLRGRSSVRLEQVEILARVMRFPLLDLLMEAYSSDESPGLLLVRQGRDRGRSTCSSVVSLRQ